MKIYNTDIKDCLHEILHEKSQIILWQKEEFADAINAYSLHYYEECYLMNQAMEVGLFTVMLLNRHISVPDYVETLKENNDIEENEALFMIAMVQAMIQETDWHIEVMNIDETVEAVKVNGHGDDLFILAMAFFDGLGVAQDYEKAYELFDYSEQLGSVRCYYYLGIMNENGWGTEENIDLARYYYQQGIRYDDDQCLYGLGHLDHDMDILVSSRDPRALYEVALDKLEHGDTESAKKVLKRGAEIYDPACLSMLGKISLREGDANALKYLAYGYYFRDREACEYLGYLYTQGKYVERNITRGVELLKQAYDEGGKAEEDAGNQYENI